MCGIAGFLHRDSTAADKKILGAMVHSIAHRGPDDEGLYTDDAVGLGARRLSIIDLSSAGHQPMIDEDSGACIVFNGEVYNHKELGQRLSLGDLKSKTDTEVVLKSYLRYGPGCLDHFIGMFAFVIWEPKKKRLFGARDRLGVKPFYYSFQKNTFFFASEIKSLLAAGIDPRPDLKSIGQYLTFGFYDHKEETFFEGIKQLPAAHTLTLESDGRFQMTKYWDLRSQDESPSNIALDSISLVKKSKDFLELFEDSLRLRLRSDVPVAVHISGGLDSTLMLAGLNKLNGGQGSMKAFSYHYQEPLYDEKPYVEELTKLLGWEVEFHPLSSAEVPHLALKAMRSQEQPYPGIITLAKHKLISSELPFQAKVILEGQGGDEIGGGYPYYVGPHLLDLIRSGAAGAALKEIQKFSVKSIFRSLAAYYKGSRTADGTPFLQKHCLNRDFLHSLDRSFDFPAPFKSHLLNMQYRDILFTKLPRILRSCDRASMAYSRELRVPFLDHRLVEFCFFLPGTLKIRHGVQRFFIREALKTLLPTRLADLPKRAVVDPQREWLRGPLQRWVRELIESSSFSQRGIFDAPAVLREYDKYVKAPRVTTSFHVWQWLSIEMWFRTFIDK
ncbi:MAG: asparagine synthase (glutamine-hydrolyzing) [Elusimicrobiota bacterium]